ncbi:MAG: hypothetical protein FWD78_15010 [Treponema sp.]|nr:hypothetical protein [Treponema sp.]
MNRCRLVLFFLLTAASISGIYAQNADETLAAEQEFSPFVTNLQGEVKNNLLRLTWTDSPSVSGPVFIYRSLAPFEQTQTVLPDRPREVPYGIESYMDELDDSGIYYYLAIASDTEGGRYEMYILPDNTVMVQMTASIGLTGIQEQPDTAGPKEAAGLSISKLNASAEDDKIVISFVPETGANLVLYRGTRPIRNTSDLLGAAIIQSNASSPFYDSTVPGIPYYYAIVPANELTRGTVSIQPGINATVDPAIIAAAAESGVRAVPLPLMAVTAAVPPPSIKQQAQLSDELVNALAGIPVYARDSSVIKDSMVFPEDLETTGGGEEYLLGSIIQNNFINRDWINAANDLTRFLSLPRSRLIEARARYYLGQCNYFNGLLTDALYEFLSVGAVYPDASPEWIQEILQKMANAEN